MNLLLRLFLIPIGYIAAVLTAASTAALIEWLRAYGPVAHDPAALSITGMMVVTDWIVLLGVIGYTAAIPSLIAIGAAEAFSLRSALYFCGAGLAVAFIASVLIEPGMLPPFVAEPAVAAASGIAGGLAYWISSGRWSGPSRKAEPPAA